MIENDAAASAEIEAVPLLGMTVPVLGAHVMQARPGKRDSHALPFTHIDHLRRSEQIVAPLPGFTVSRA